MRYAAAKVHREVNDSGPQRAFCRGEIKAHEFYGIVQNRLSLNMSFEEFTAAYVDIFNEPSGASTIIPQLRQLGCPIFMFSNTNRLFSEHLSKRYPQMAEPFTRLFLSHKIEALKSEEEAFRTADTVIRGILAKPSGAQLVYVDNHKINCTKGRQKGWTALQYDCRHDIQFG